MVLVFDFQQVEVQSHVDGSGPGPDDMMQVAVLVHQFVVHAIFTGAIEEGMRVCVLMTESQDDSTGMAGAYANQIDGSNVVDFRMDEILDDGAVASKMKVGFVCHDLSPRSFICAKVTIGIDKRTAKKQKIHCVQEKR